MECLRRGRSMVVAVSLLGAGALTALACGSSPAEGFQPGEGADASVAPTAGEGDGGLLQQDAEPSLGDASVDTGAPAQIVLYAHDNRALYKVDAKDPALALTRIGDFDCIVGGASPPAGMDTSMTDIAVDRAGRIYGVGPRMFFADMAFDGDAGGPVGCLGKGKALNAPAGVKFFGATFAPVGTLDPNEEALVVGNTEGDLFRIDITSGAATRLGSFGTVPSDDGNGHRYTYPGTTWQLSGDLVFLDNGGKPLGFATVRDCRQGRSGTNDCNAVDTLVEIDMAKLSAGAGTILTKRVMGQIVKGAGCNDIANEAYGSMYGIAAYEDSIVGFSRDGFVVRIDNSRGVACRIADHKADVPGGFSGAGVTTLVPVKPPVK